MMNVRNLDGLRSRRVAGLILASGESRRFGESNKLLAPVAKKALIRRTVEAYFGSDLASVTVVLGADAGPVAAVLDGLDVQLVHNPDFKQGQSRALVFGIQALEGDSSAVVVGVADQPLLRRKHVRSIVAAYSGAPGSVVVPRYAGTRGNPVLFDRDLFAELCAVQGDRGGRSVVELHRGAITWVDFDDARPRLDVDTVDDMETVGRHLLEMERSPERL